MTPEQFKLVGHTLGINTYHAELSTRKKDKYLPDEFYRNYFCLGSEEAHDYSEWQTLESQDLAERWMRGDDLYFCITHRGIRNFRNWFHVNVTRVFVPLSRHKERYQKYLDADCCETFAEWMGIQPPQLDQMQILTVGGHRQGYRYESTKYYGLRGSWQWSRKLAKESYKEKLRQYHKERREELTLKS